MKKEDLRIVFMGTPEFAVESLKALVENDYNVVGVITSPDKPAGRGYKIQQSPVKKYALEHDIFLLQPEKLKNEVFLNELRKLKADLQIVVAFRMLPEVVWNMPPKGTFNLHASLLPQYRGAAPINWAIINGEEETGVTTFFLSHEIDTGKIIFQKKVAIEKNDNAETLHNKLMKEGAGLVIKTVDAILNDTVETISQNEYLANQTELKPAPKIYKETCKINWDQPTKNIYNFIRGLSPYPTAWTVLEIDPENTLHLKLFESSVMNENHALLPGTIVTDNKTYLNVATKDGFIGISDIQPAGKKRMKIRDFLNGFHIPNHAVFK
jgi:methionyl-tRNA formyltransferase